MILDSVRKRWLWLKHLSAASACDRAKLMDEAAFGDFTIEIIKGPMPRGASKSFHRRWGVERTFESLARWRRLVRDDEERIT